MKALYFNEFGNSSVLKYGQVADPKPTNHDLLVQTAFIGLNFADIYRRRGDYQIKKHAPYINGYEAAGTVVKVGNAVENWTVGERVLFVDVPLANAELVAIPVEKAIKIPSDLTTKMAATIGLQGLTADFLAHDLVRSHPGDNAFIHGISGGVGQLLAQILMADGVNVFGSVSTKAKQQVALKHGASKVYLRVPGWHQKLESDFDAVFDGIGSTVSLSLKLAKRRGTVVFFGIAGGNPPKIDLLDVMGKSQTLATGDLWDYLTSAKERQRRSSRLFAYVQRGLVKPVEPTIFDLDQGKQAYDYLESGKSVGKVLLTPED